MDIRNIRVSKTHLLGVTIVNMFFVIALFNVILSVTPRNAMSFLATSPKVVTGFPLLLSPTTVSPSICITGVVSGPLLTYVPKPF